ncbi:MAG TPA: ATP-dependent RNA helicase DbpA [Sulfurospirillum cavolei]|uniref:ATP-dependent RNA helicase DbpA n=1 Tax=Sulfurospirillum cavolei TaxID=366522 RepID=A0A2D3W4X1_9BACT|nr:MAG TPA: ATP-dependent RNA helicase DbpA [Sulfurospirillum cavolei]
MFNAYIQDPKMLQNLNYLGYVSMTPVQRECIPLALEGKDLVAKAKTGSGKTAAFGLPLLLSLHVNSMRIQSVVLCPTRELAEQVSAELRRLARFAHNIKIVTLCGGARFVPQCINLEHGAHIVVGTPGRILQHLQEKTINFEHIKTLVLDEADRMLDMGFFEDIEKIIAKMPQKRQTLLFSATFPKEIERMCKEVQHDALHVSIEEDTSTSSNIAQIYYSVEPSEKEAALKGVLLQSDAKSVIIFCKTKVGVAELQGYLIDEGFDALSLHGDLEQIDRDEHLLLFANGSAQILVATDLAARGLDIKDVELVINYELPQTMEIYTHRIGRTGRMGKEGKAISFVTPREESFLEELKEANFAFTCKSIGDLNPTLTKPKKALYITLCIDAGKKQKLRAGDILGTLTKDLGLSGSVIGKIDILEKYSYVAIEREYADKAFNGLCATTIKNRRFKIWKLG